MIGILVGHTILTKYGLNNTTVKLIFIEGALTLLITLVLAFVSYHLMEKRFLKLKEKFAFIKT
jgi:peptidoglycan/LPS O-acetylase OafA/YrhL